MITPFLSKVVEMYDYKDIDCMRYVDAFVFDEEQLQVSLEFLRKKYAYRIEVQTIEKGDFATLKCSSDVKKFQKDSISLNVGKNLYSKELEEQLLGLHVGECKTLVVNENEVEVEVLKIERNELPELTDEFIDKTFIELSNYDDLIQWYKNDQKENYLLEQSKGAAEAISGEVIKKSVFEIDVQEKNEARLSGKAIIEEMWEFNGMPLDTMSDEQAMEILGYPSVQAYIDWFMDLNEKSFYESLLGYELLSQLDQVPGQEQYEQTVLQYCEEEGKTEEELKESFTFTAFMKQTCAEKYIRVIQEHVYEKLKEVTL